VVAAVTAARRQAGHAAGPLAGDEEPVVAQLGVGAGDSRAADRERIGELPFAGQTRPDRHSTVGDQHAQALGQALVGGGLVEPAEQTGYPRGGEDT
jgi:hypothetical protein